MQEGYIYKITSPTNKVYIGQTVNTHKRFLRYKGLRCKHQPRIYNSLLKYGYENHLIIIIEQCTTDIINARERYWQDHYDVIGENGLNCVLTKTDEKYLVWSEESRKKLSNSKRGKKLSEKQKLSLKNRRLGYKHSDETKKKMSDNNRRINLGVKFSDEINKKKGSKGEKHPLYGIGHSKESRDKMSKSHKGKKRSPEAIEKFIKSIKGRMVGEDNPSSKTVLNIRTGIYYTSIKEARTYSYPNISLHMIYKMLSGGCENKTNLIYV